MKADIKIVEFGNEKGLVFNISADHGGRAVYA
jgi:hypothetical protein